MKEYNLFRQLLKLVKTGTIEDAISFAISSELSEKRIFVYKKDGSQFNELLKSLYNSNNIFVEEAFSIFRDQVLEMIKDELLSNVVITEERMTEFINSIRTKPNRVWEIFRPLYNVTLSEDRPVKLGPYTVIDFAKHNHMVLNKYPNVGLEQLWLMKKEVEETDIEGIYISVLIVAKTASKAEELSIEKFQVFENVMRFVIGNSQFIDVRILDYKPIAHSDILIISENDMVNNLRVNGVYSHIDLFEPRIHDHIGSWVWSALSDDNLSNMGKRIIFAISWVGKGLKEVDYGMAVVQYVFALEVLFTFQEKGVFLTPSIVYQLAETSAIVLGNTVEERKEIVKEINNLYRLRSSIAHGGKSSVEKDIAMSSYCLVRDIIYKLITNEELLKIDSIDSLRTWVDNKKYS